MPIHSRKNQYRGVNAHLHSALQGRSGLWPTFHGAHIIDIAQALDAVLPPVYVVVPEISMQIRETHPRSGEPVTARKAGRKRPDLSIHDLDPSAHRASEAPAGLTAPTLTLPAIDESDDPEIYFTAAVVHELGDDLPVGKAVTWIELLSPTNKPPGSGYGQYREKRYAALNSGIVLVEIDYLHESRPVLIDRVPSYPDGDLDAHAYSIVITDPRPTPREGELAVYGFDVDTTMPVLAIPLSGNDSVKLDFGALYSTTFESLRFYSDLVDYEQLPVRFETYREDDQQRIQARMQAVIEAYQKGVDLETGPFELAERQL